MITDDEIRTMFERLSEQINVRSDTCSITIHQLLALRDHWLAERQARKDMQEAFTNLTKKAHAMCILGDANTERQLFRMVLSELGTATVRAMKINASPDHAGGDGRE